MYSIDWFLAVEASEIAHLDPRTCSQNGAAVDAIGISAAMSEAVDQSIPNAHYKIQPASDNPYHGSYLKIQGGMTMRPQGKVAVITGAASGMGLAMATRFAAEGASVVAADWNAERI